THLGHPCHPPTPHHDLPTSRTRHDVPKHTEYAPHHTVVSTTTPAQPDAMETVQDYWGSVPEPPDPRTKSTEAPTSTPYTVDTTHSTDDHQLPYRVITPV
ncbi:hypothetical protein BDN67DRAFT_976036, partial [Paxillus ammoniavirescens]